MAQYDLLETLTYAYLLYTHEQFTSVRRGPIINMVPKIFLGEGNGNSLQYSCLENPTDRGAWKATVHWVTRVRHNLATKPLKIFLRFHPSLSPHFTLVTFLNSKCF